MYEQPAGKSNMSDISHVAVDDIPICWVGGVALQVKYWPAHAELILTDTVKQKVELMIGEVGLLGYESWGVICYSK